MESYALSLIFFGVFHIILGLLARGVSSYFSSSRGAFLLVNSVVGTACVAFSAISVLLARKGVTQCWMDKTGLIRTGPKWTGDEQRDE